ncbi:MAG TPA: chondroitinase-B domain-containing protein [Usitatibacter sp.]|nr:chondroitinase-B domain-containing protein [Usitatibacter sp.]
MPGFAQSTTGAPANITANGATMSGLQCGTKYRYRITDTSTGTPYTYTFTTSACAVTGGPQATTMAATNVGSSGATFNGSVMPNGADTSVSFDYGTSTAYGTNVAASPASVTASSPATSVSASVTSLACGTSYHFRVKATNSAGTASGADQSFTTAACPASAPVATTSAATNPGPGGATLNGSVTPNGAATSVTFDYGTSTGYGSSIAASPASIAASAQATAVTGALSGLKCGTTYHFRVHATNGAGTTLGNDLSFATTACAVVTAPQATTNPGSGMTGTGGTVNGSVAPDGGSTTVSFDYGTTTAYGSSIAATPATLAGTSPVTNVTANLSNLACATTYHFRVVAVNSAGTSRGADQALTTAACGTTSAGPWPWPTWTGQVIAVPPSSTGNTYYVDGTNGSDTNAGTSATAAFKTLAKAVGKVAAGDTVLIRKGLYREGINLGNGQSGTAGKPITFGSYGDGEVILDGSAKVTGWTLVSGTVWQAQASFKPIGVVVNDVPLKQVTQGQGGSTAPQVGLAGVTSGSGKWYVSSNVITADFGTTLGSGDPNGADIVVPNSNGAQEHIYWYGSSYVTFQGLTIRGSGSNGLWGYGNNITVLNCDIKFNGKAAVSFLSGGVSSNSDNAVLYSEAYHNVLLNWPRGNNGYMEDGGGWPGTLVWESNLRPLARGNIVHMNGGEGILSYGTQSGRPSGSALFEQNVSYDNWSVDMYFDNQPNDVARQNLLFNHPPNPNDYLYVGKYPYDSPGKFAVCIMLADEQNSSDSTNGYANLRGTQVHDNIMAGCRIGIRDYSEGTQAIAHHGLKDTTIANNTIVMAYNDVPNSYVAGIYLQDNGSNNTNSVIQNNIVYGFNQDAVFFSEHAGALAGINVDFNDYYSTAAKPFGSGYNTVTYYAFAGWKAATPGADTHSLFQDPLLDDAVQFRTQGTAAWNYASAGVAPTSPTINSGTAQSFAPAVNFAGAPRVGWSMGAL